MADALQLGLDLDEFMATRGITVSGARKYKLIHPATFSKQEHPSQIEATGAYKSRMTDFTAKDFVHHFMKGVTISDNQTAMQSSIIFMIQLFEKMMSTMASLVD